MKAGDELARRRAMNVAVMLSRQGSALSRRRYVIEPARNGLPDEVLSVVSDVMVAGYNPALQILTRGEAVERYPAAVAAWDRLTDMECRPSGG